MYYSNPIIQTAFDENPTVDVKGAVLNISTAFDKFGMMESYF